MVRLAAYGSISTALALCVVVNAFRQRSNFYSAAVYLYKSQACMMILWNFGVFLTVVFGRLLQLIFFGPLRTIEVERVHERGWYTVTETLLALTIFREEFNSLFIVLFMSLLFLKVFHWLASDRVEMMEQSPHIPRLFHIRMVLVLVLLAGVDIGLIAWATRSLAQEGPSVKIMFAAEYLILTASLWSTACKYAINVYDMNSEEEWESKSMMVFYVDMATDFLKLLTYLSFFALLLAFYGLPINILRDVYVTTRSFILKCRDLARYRQATKNMDERYPNATAEDMGRMGDGTCIICREEMVVAGGLAAPADGAGQTGTDGQAQGQAPAQTEAPAPPPPPPASARSGPNNTPKKLPCGHIFHFHCLRSWLERQQSCPTCRRAVLETDPTTPQRGGAGGDVRANGAAGARGNGADRNIGLLEAFQQQAGAGAGAGGAGGAGPPGQAGAAGGGAAAGVDRERRTAGAPRRERARAYPPPPPPPGGVSGYRTDNPLVRFRAPGAPPLTTALVTPTPVRRDSGQTKTVRFAGETGGNSEAKCGESLPSNTAGTNPTPAAPSGTSLGLSSPPISTATPSTIVDPTSASQQTEPAGGRVSSADPKTAPSLISEQDEKSMSPDDRRKIMLAATLKRMGGATKSPPTPETSQVSEAPSGTATSESKVPPQSSKSNGDVHPLVPKLLVPPETPTISSAVGSGAPPISPIGTSMSSPSSNPTSPLRTSISPEREASTPGAGPSRPYTSNSASRNPPLPMTELPRLIPLFDPSNPSRPNPLNELIPFLSPSAFGTVQIPGIPSIPRASPSVSSSSASSSILSPNLSQDQLYSLSKLTKEGMEERLRLLMNIQETVSKCVEEIGKAINVMPSAEDIIAAADYGGSGTDGREQGEREGMIGPVVSSSSPGEKGKAPIEGDRARKMEVNGVDSRG